MTVESILTELERLSLKERKVIAEQLAYSIEQSEEEEILQAQLAVVKQRIADVEAGRSKLIEESESDARIEALLNE